MNAIELIAAERARQCAKGYDAAEEGNGQLADAAYMLLFEHLQGPGCVDEGDDLDGWGQALAVKLRHAEPVRRLVVAAALLAAEIDRLSSVSASADPSPYTQTNSPIRASGHPPASRPTADRSQL